MINLIIVRHAKTEWNIRGKIQGRSDVPLIGESRIAATELGKQLSGENINAVYSSPLSRAKDTADCLLLGAGKDSLTVITDERLTERDFGHYEGRTYDELGIGDHTRLFYELDDSIAAEPCEAVFERVRSFLRELETRRDSQTVLIVSHGVCISFLVYALTHTKWDEKGYSMNYIPNLTALRYTFGGDVQ